MSKLWRVIGAICSDPYGAARDPFLRIVVAVILAIVALFVLLAVL